MHSINVLQQHINHGLNNLNIPEHPENLYGSIRYMLQIGGKRVRPLLTLMAADLFSITDITKALPAALAVELFHNFSLMHDDIMDNAPLRRGQQTVHEKWNPNVAILSGDNLLIMAYRQLAKCPPEKLPQLLEAFNTMATEVCEGQQLDMDFENMASVGIDDYLRMIRLKTSVLLGTALKMGAILADATEVDVNLIYDFGVAVGIAFQLQDDILDVYGDPAQFGKQRGGDILANKKTYLLIKALETAGTDIRPELDRWLATDGPAEAKVNAVTVLYDRLGVRQAAELAKQRYIEQAYAALDAIGVHTTRKTPLRTLAQTLLNRTS
ncbi:geranylgeranyl diphosphate synthase, type II [Parapedobacter composti]|uniref:Geranylgeranyl diphosphate synthase, type II n=1 Tax=Parapedobacter composti TaxID=623281 RepID=A0A1I1DUS8_9SPHI|nr:polyprenyl synthetase family protein [Parapedobacter composti]SFB78809.1 geranylgeranyl diphosphate synthase, type II [Parapedobacter composti]